jgi:hypothetical protein
MNRFVWNMRLPGAPRLADESLDPWQREDGPMVLSGQYQVRLSAEGQSWTQPFEIVPDPRLSVASDDLRSQFELLQRILELIATANTMINRVGALQTQVTTWEGWTADHPQSESVRAASGPLQSALASLKDRLIDVHYPEAQLHAIGLQEKLNALFEFVDSADYAPPQQAREVLADLSTRLNRLVEEFERDVRPKVAAFNATILAAGVPPVIDEVPS